MILQLKHVGAFSGIVLSVLHKLLSIICTSQARTCNPFTVALKRISPKEISCRSIASSKSFSGAPSTYIPIQCMNEVLNIRRNVRSICAAAVVPFPPWDFLKGSRERVGHTLKVCKKTPFYCKNVDALVFLGPFD